MTPDPAATCLKSATQVRLGAGATKSWSSRSGARAAAGSGMVDHLLAADGAGEAELAHQTLDRAAGHLVALPVERSSAVRRTVPARLGAASSIVLCGTTNAP
ncbi:hypothetical protein AMK21_31450 [Streptomyces sp. CB00316]|nr:MULTISPECIES: hypothetical protein [unclassified Streptomyces]MBT2379704.1 hypothetical protein [Streptomyces sp. ISL-111]OKJ09411.1 hypothetical protein AMK21_31450 [Streptomyces sp. CB00316]